MQAFASFFISVQCTFHGLTIIDKRQRLSVTFVIVTSV